MTGKRALAVGLLASVALCLTLGSAGAQAGPGGMGRGMMGGDGDVARHRAYMIGGVPAPYAGQTNPLPATPATIAAGRTLYNNNCAVCHGADGRGDGVVGKTLNPPPSDLMALLHMPMASDGYLFWTIAEGGNVLGTAMPAFKDTLSADDTWKIIAALRAGLPPAKQ